MERIDDKSRKKFAKYVSLNILAMLGSSCYIVADTFFIANGIGADGLTALNLAISIFSFIQAIGLMVGIGSGTRYAVSKSRGERETGSQVFTNAIVAGIAAGCLIGAAGLLFAGPIAEAIGADQITKGMTSTYLRVIMFFAPFYIVNHTIVAFVRNDGNPKLATIAMLAGNFSNIVLDYVFIYLFKWGMFGASFATGIGPVISICCLSIHFIKKQNQFKLIRTKVLLQTVVDFCKLGISSFVNELSTGAVIMIFNFLFLGLGGNTAVAAYGIVANVALFAVSIFTGIAQGIQPLVSDYYGRGLTDQLKTVLKDASLVALVLTAVIVVISNVWSDGIVSIFNKSRDAQLQSIAKEGITIYFLGFFPGSLNIVLAGYLSAMEKAEKGFIISLLRGLVVIAPSALLLSKVFGMTGVWTAIPVTETITLLAALYMTRRIIYPPLSSAEIPQSREL
ncbi:MATE family efflux transporter [Emergencia sp.]|uniref:MATE family efflux transporter n=1 Tax=Emergencia sp. TaxID=1926557 RepID=UPI003AF1D6C2